MIEKIKSLIREFITRRKYPSCIIERYTIIDKKSILAGENVVGSGTVLLETSVGMYTYIRNDSYFFKTKIGKFCSIAANVKGIYGNHPLRDNISTSPVFYSKGGNGKISFCKDDLITYDVKYPKADDNCLINIGNDVWIGNDVRIMCGVNIGTGSVIGAESLVTKDVPPFSIVGGVPARVIRYRFDEDDIRMILKSKWWDRPEEWLITHANEFIDINKFRKIENI